MGRMGGVLHDAVCFTGASCKENILDGGERGTNDLVGSSVHCPLEGLAVCYTTVPVPESDAAGQHSLNGSPVEGGEDGWRETCSFQPAEKVLICGLGEETETEQQLELSQSFSCIVPPCFEAAF